jgi:hypothetical protein
MRRAALVLVVVVALGACESERIDPLETFAASSCAAIQGWVDAVEDYTTQLSHAVTPLDHASDRVGYYRIFARAIEERTNDTIRQLKRLTPATGDGRAAADVFVESMEGAQAVTEQLIELADSFPDGDDDPEPLVSRISSLFVRLEKGFSIPSKARDALAERYPVFDRVPACTDYDDPVS